MKTIRLALLLAALTTTHLFAQTRPAESATDARVAEGKPQRFDLKVDGIPLSDLLNYLTDVTGENIVLLTPPNVDANQIQVPPLKLKRVSLEQVLELLTSIPDLHMEYEVSGDESRVISLRVFNGPPTTAPGADAPGKWAAAFQPIPAGAQTPAGGTDQAVLSVLPLERLLFGANPMERVPDDAKRQELLDARTKQAFTLIEQAFAMDLHGQAMPEIKLHAETHTLLVKANQAQLFVVHEVLSALEVPGPSDAKKDFDRQLQDVLRESESQQRHLKDEMQQKLRMMEEQYLQMQRSRDELEKRANELTDELGQLRAINMVLEARQAKTANLRKQLAKAEAEMGANSPTATKLRAELEEAEKN